MVNLLTSEQQAAILAAMRECGAIIRNAHAVESNAASIHVKPGSANFVTEYDVKVQEILIEKLSAILPEAAFFAEEKDNAAETARQGLCFVIDPIDGTTNFIHDYKASSISVGLLQDSEPVYGAVYDPYRDELFTAFTGMGAYLNGERISVSNRPLALALVCFGASPYDKEKLAPASFALAKEVFMQCADIRRSGSAAIDMCGVACGRADAFFEPKLSPWDYMASAVIIKEAGGLLCRFNGEPVSFEKPNSVCCVNKAASEELLKITTQFAENQ